MKQFHDQTGKLVFIPSPPPRRIVSLVPSLTELLYSLQLDTEVVGTKNANVALIKSLEPDLVIATKEENVKEQVDAMAVFCPVYCSDISNLDEAYEAIAQIGSLTDRSAKAEELIGQLRQNFGHLHPLTNKLRCLYLIWNKPYMSAGGDTFIHAMLTAAGFENVLQNQLRYPETGLQQIAALDVDVVFFSSEPFPFKQQHLDAFTTEWQQQLPQKKMPLLRIVDGEIFSWYGSRLLHATEYFKKLRESLFLSDELTV